MGVAISRQSVQRAGKVASDKFIFCYFTFNFLYCAASVYSSILYCSVYVIFGFFIDLVVKRKSGKMSWVRGEYTSIISCSYFHCFLATVLLVILYSYPFVTS